MKSFFCICFILLSVHEFSAQDELSISSKVYFSEQIATNINAYKYKIGKAKAAQDFKRVAQLYNEFINKKLIDSYLDDFNINCFDRRKNNLSDFDKPLVLLTYADWCAPLEDEMEILNRHIKMSHGKIDFLVLIWHDKKQARKLAKPFYKKAEILYVNELRNRDEHMVRMLKHALGVPTLIITNSDRKIIDILKLTASFPNLFEYNFEKRMAQAINKI
ncbi:TlpA family protein disulfide reductase [Flavobacteriaceae bacterium 14752]|uniref:TlpA family protein disulfide reductase n=1 Tax=Mesohalobacter salilacus TaxID=2491711 RepID=UPI000F6376B1|nr:TlpA family protein disulfide reductase [Flavobacteriaceae bacterium 14752]